MFAELNNLLGWSQTQLPSETMCFVRETSDEGSLVLHHLMSLFLKANGGSVCIVGLAQSFTHYSSVATRLSLNLNKLKQDGRFVFVDAMKHIGEDTLVKCGIESAGGNDCWLNYHPDQPHSSIKGLFWHIKELLKNLNEKTVVIIDDVSILAALGLPVQDVVYFIEYLKKEVMGKRNTLAMLCHCTEGDNDMELLWRQLSYHSDVIFEVSCLQTGLSRDVHGEMKVIKKDSSLLPGKDNVKKVQFKISDRNVHFFALGLSAAVIGH
ncbi:hypothetical protein CAPTEDRAFT_20925 [Capitella teleta]|uniref:Elongator complex protein 6 n=1 Tax=Capitella teleta TaxID=283909 RepID=R7U3W7_CAPTE|nr:hypothetical protein CAPTEDRAFT_20925 [Capitella teleta]|eukprot:ELU01035.1 hypothetical protein CAPTEDRAFT_20925 [Capitella teleta]